MRYNKRLSAYNYRVTVIASVIVIMSNIIAIPAFAQQQQQGINWLEICKNPMVDAMITEPCETLTSPDGYTLTPQGEHVLACIGGGTLALLTGHPELISLRTAVGCGGNSDSSSSGTTQSNPSGSSSFGSTQSDNSNPIGNIISGLLNK